MADESILCIVAETKTCTQCKETKSLSEFLAKGDGKRRAECKICHAAYARKWYADNKEKRREYYRQYVERNPEKIRKHRDKSFKKLSQDPGWKKKKSDYLKKRHITYKYSITHDQWMEMFNYQNGACALCQIHGRVGKHGKLYVDHCHYSGNVRGLLCAVCNQAIGVLGDTAERLERAVSYLRGTAPNIILSQEQKDRNVRRTRK